PAAHCFATRRSSDLVGRGGGAEREPAGGRGGGLVDAQRDGAGGGVELGDDEVVRAGGHEDPLGVLHDGRGIVEARGEGEIMAGRSEEHTSELQSPYD